MSGKKEDLLERIRVRCVDCDTNYTLHVTEATLKDASPTTTSLTFKQGASHAYSVLSPSVLPGRATGVDACKFSYVTHTSPLHSL